MSAPGPRRGLVAAVVLVLFGCDGVLVGPAGQPLSGDPSVVTPGAVDPAAPGPAEASPWGTPSVGLCVDQPSGLTYVGFSGNALEADRENLEASADRARLKSYDSLDEIRNEFDYGATLGTTITNDALATFEAHPTYEVPETQGGPLMIFSAFRYGYLGCLKALRTTVPSTAFGRHVDFKSSPTLESARRQCQRFAVRYWKREADAEEVEACAAFAVTETAGEPTPDRQWALLCGVMAAAADNLTY